MPGRVSTGVAVFVLPALLVLGPARTASGMATELPGSTSTSTTTPSATTTTTATTTAARTTAPAICRTPSRRGFAPTSAQIKDVGRRIPVLAMGRGSGRVPLPPPMTSLGKRSFAWDMYGPKPGAQRGNVRFNAHTYPDGSALGNKLLRQLQVGDRIILRGDAAALCYKVTKRVTVTPRSFLYSYYSTTGKPKVAIVVCSGRRLGPGNWTHRTIWFAKPSTT